MCSSSTTKAGLLVGAVTLFVWTMLTANASLFAQQQASRIPVGPASSLAPAPGSKIISFSRKVGSYSEPSIAVYPQNPKQVVAASQAPASVAYSEDAGESLQLASGTVPENYKVSGDVSITYDVLG